MGTEYERRLRETLDQIEAQDSMRMVECDPGGLADYLGSAENALRLIGGVEKVSLPAELMRNFHRYSRLTVAWRAEEPYQMIGGEFRLVHVAVALLAGSSKWLTDMAHSEKQRRLYEEFRVFETHPVGGTGTCSALRLVGSQDSPEIWYFDISQGATQLHVSYGDYLDLLLRARGLYYWQYLFAEPDQNNWGISSALSSLHDGLDFLVRTFPLDNMLDLRLRLEERSQGDGGQL